MVVLAKLVASCEDYGYITFVFECLEEAVIKQTKYVMCVMFPNWEHETIKLDDIGYLEYKEIRAGIDKWYDGDKFIPYKYNTNQFLKFVKKPDESANRFIM